MNRHRASQGMFLLGLASLIWSFGTLSCGGGGGGAGAVPPQQLVTEAIVHESMISGPHLILTAGPSGPISVRTVTFTPKRADDLLLNVSAEVAWDEILQLFIEVRDDSGRLLASNTVFPGVAGTARLTATLPTYAVLQYLGSTYPAPTYSVELFCIKNPNFDVSLTGLKFSFGVLEGARKVTGSTLITG